MNYKFLLFLLLSFSGVSAFAQKTKTDVVVYGSGSGAISAAIQAARSGVKAILVNPETELNTNFSDSEQQFLTRIKNHYKSALKSKDSKKDSLGEVDSSKIIIESTPDFSVKKLLDTIQRLTVLNKSDFTKIEESGKGWDIKMADGSTIKCDVLIDGSSDFKAAQLLKVNPEQTIIPFEPVTNNAYLNNVFRTSVGYAYKVVSEINQSAFLVPIGSLLPQGTENFIIIPQGNKRFRAESMTVGQAAGATAAYCSFFKTTTKKLNIRVIQGELLGYDSRLIPFSDIDFKDRHAIAFQHIGLSGLIKLNSDSNGKFNFDTLGTVSTDELKLPMKDLYSRSQIWFADNKTDSLKIKDVINLFMYSVARGEELRKEIENGWKDSFAFNTKYDPERAINRREFAVLSEAYLQPFNVRVDLNGKLIN
ncbi:MAG: FAD-dependent oxidoreductase [Daejeonella sp.]